MFLSLKNTSSNFLEGLDSVVINARQKWKRCLIDIQLGTFFHALSPPVCELLSWKKIIIIVKENIFLRENNLYPTVFSYLTHRLQVEYLWSLMSVKTVFMLLDRRVEGSWHLVIDIKHFPTKRRTLVFFLYNLWLSTE